MSEVSHFDLAVIGGGINGAGIARDAALSGLKVLILDKNDFAYGSSSRSTKLVHGGIRYLENREFGLVWEACHERKILTKIAPHLVRIIPFVIPVYEGDKRPLWMIRLGMFLYDAMAGFKNIKRHKGLSVKKILERIPGLKQEGLKGGGIYYDCQTDDARLTLVNIQDVVRHGGTAKNYTKVLSLEENENGILLNCEDTVTKGKAAYTAVNVVNATGPWLDENLQNWGVSSTKNLRLTKGVHFFIPNIGKENALLVSSAKDNRVFFIVPYGDLSLVGTTDTDYKGSLDHVVATQEDVEYLLNELRRLFPDTEVSIKDIKGVYAGLRPLLHEEGVKEGKVSREYTLKEDKIGSATLLSVIGGKLTTYRSLSKKVIDKLAPLSKKEVNPCKTYKIPLPGSQYKERTFEEFELKTLESPEFKDLPADIAQNLVRTYGSDVKKVVPYLASEEGRTRILSGKPYVWGQCMYGMEHEFIRAKEDFTRRRTDLYIYS
ncbi:glycerol-3-phosphate dehydrogenase [Pseudomonadota bacterium]